MRLISLNAGNFNMEFGKIQGLFASKRWDREESVADRFEVYYQRIELVNGNRELTDASEQRQRFQEANENRLGLKKKPLPIDKNFLHALEKGLPDCCRLPVGFDHLMMLRQKQNDIADVIPWGWQVA